MNARSAWNGHSTTLRRAVFGQKPHPSVVACGVLSALASRLLSAPEEFAIGPIPEFSQSSDVANTC
jgi:hypothetical protein